jgi:hypothetical protein
MEPGDIPVLREEHVASLSTELDARFRQREGVARRVAPNNQRDSPDVPRRRGSKALHPIG